MRLAAASSGDVVRNSNNGSHYRFDRVEKSKARIRPLELFPSGRLVPKPTDTLVSTEIDVLAIGRWSEGMRVEGGSARSLAAYQQELVEQRARLVLLEAEYETLPQSGVGRLSRGSFANKVKNCRARIETLCEGLGIGDGPTPILVTMTAPSAATFTAGDLVQVPSGRAGLILNTLPGQAVVRTTLGAGFVQAQVPTSCLRPWAEARLATV